MAEKNESLYRRYGYANITVKKETKDRLMQYGKMGMKWDELFNALLDEIEECRKKKQSPG